MLTRSITAALTCLALLSTAGADELFFTVYRDDRGRIAYMELTE